MCHASISPLILYASKNSEFFHDESQGVSAALACPSCHRLFVIQLSDDINYGTFPIISAAPQFPPTHTFDPALSDVSEQFVEIFHQAEAAEAFNLTQITGIGYRKALEFLIKDYSIRLHPEQSDSIKSAPLSQCIEKYIDHAKIKATAKAAAWIGNDESHYIRKWDNRDIADLKKFIMACSNWILSDLAYDDAEDMIKS